MAPFKAVYENGVLRPVHPLPLAEGATVEVTITPTEVAGPPLPRPLPRPLTPEQAEYARRLAAAKTLQEMFAIMEAEPDDLPADYDIVKALDENRRFSGSLPWFPTEDETK